MSYKTLYWVVTYGGISHVYLWLFIAQSTVGYSENVINDIIDDVLFRSVTRREGGVCNLPCEKKEALQQSQKLYYKAKIWMHGRLG